MKALAQRHWAAFRLALRRLATEPATTVLSLLSFGIALALPFGGTVLFHEAQRVANNSSALPQISVFMKLEADRAAAEETADKLRRLPAVASVQFLPREATLERMRRSQELAGVLAALPRNPFPDALAITPRNTEAKEMEQLAADLRQWPRIEYVQIDSAWIERLNAIFSVGRLALGILASVLGIGLVAIVFNTLRLQALTSEIHVAAAALARPAFLYYGTLLGAFGGVSAWLITAAAISALKAPAMELAGLYGLDIALGLPGVAASVYLLATTAALGWSGSFVSLSRPRSRPTMR